MSIRTARNLAFVLLIALWAGPVGRAFGSTAGQPSGQSASPTTSQSSPSDGITGTDPEPIDPDIVGIVLTLLDLA
jgi:hypothetical protein